MKNVYVITGGGSGMGLATAKLFTDKDDIIILTGRTVEKLKFAVNELQALGIASCAFPCDVSDINSVRDLANHASSLGRIVAVIHAAGVSPHMDNGKRIMEINALGTINVDEVFLPIMENNSCIINVSSMAGYFMPKIIIPKKVYRLALSNKDQFFKKMMKRIKIFPKKFRADVAYGLSKNFVIWYSAAMASDFGENGIRILSVSPGTFDTPMGEVEKDEAITYRKYCAFKRSGKSEEIAKLIEFLVRPDAGYLTGVDILMDGGCVAGKKNNIA
ncbi:MAG: SDR family NAD(P)-dependent oxidoreductase [Pleomorphochaeta sp.]